MKRKAKELQLQKRQMERSGGSRGGGTTYGEREYAWGKETPAPQPAPAAAAASSTSTTDAAKKWVAVMRVG